MPSASWRHVASRNGVRACSFTASCTTWAKSWSSQSRRAKPVSAKAGGRRPRLARSYTAGMSFLRARSPVTPNITNPHDPAMRGKRRSRGSRRGLTTGEPPGLLSNEPRPGGALKVRRPVRMPREGHPHRRRSSRQQRDMRYSSRGSGDCFLCLRCHVLGREAVLLKQGIALSRLAKVVNGDDLTGVTDNVTPTEGRTC